VGRASQLTSKGEVEEDMNFNLYLPKDFSMALKQKFGRKFTFGPIEFNDLDKEFDGEAARKMVIDSLEQSAPMQEPGSNICVHGHKVQVKERNLKRGTTMLKHSRFLPNLMVKPVWPAEPEPEVAADAGEDEEAAE